MKCNVSTRIRRAISILWPFAVGVACAVAWVVMQAPAHAQAEPVEIQIEATGTIDIDWQPPTENVDGTPLEDLAGYNLYWGFASRAYIDQRAITDETAESAQVQITLTAVGQTEVYAALTAIDADGNESVYSNEVVKAVTLSVTLPPKPPGNVTMEFTVDGCVVLNVPGAECSVTVEDL